MTISEGSIMVPGFEVETLNKFGKLIANLERYHLEDATPPEINPVDLFDEEGHGFFRVRGLADFWSHQPLVDFTQCVTDLIIGTHTQKKADLTFVMLGTPRQLSVYISLGPEQTTQTMLEGMFPGIILEPISSSQLIKLVEPHMHVQGILTGVPSGKAPPAGTSQEGQAPHNTSGNNKPTQKGKQSQAQIERIIRGMYGSHWVYIVQAHPRPRHKVVQERMKTVDLLTQINSHARVNWQSTQQETKQVTTTHSGGTNQTFSGDLINYRAQYLIKLLEHELTRLDQASATGQWLVKTYFGTHTLHDTQRLGSLLLGTFAGADSRPEPLRISICQKASHSVESFNTFLNSYEIAALLQFPREEVMGYAIHDHVRFDVDFHTNDDQALPLGYIQHNGKDTQETFNISTDALTKHVVVIGVTGSGKTTTVMNLIDRVVDAHKPFLIIEPAKTEYRALRSSLAPRTDLRIYTLGNEMIAPFRLNPFEFETNDEPGSGSLLTHIDFLNAVFTAAFPMYSPLPQVLEAALHEIYEDKGWDVTTSTNRRIRNWSERHIYPIFPTMTDLYHKTEVIANRLKYDREADSNIKAALKARIGSLRIGSKGLMLDTVRGIPMAELFAHPTVLELEAIGNDEEKTFIMGLLLAKLYEFRRLQAAHGNLANGLQHLIVFEEAHRLLKNTSTEVDSESGNMRAKAIEVFTNMLSEVRAYGQGVLVAEQIPSKLAPDVLKNTNLKIVHRLIAQDDRDSIGVTMNLQDEQKMHLGMLHPGRAAVYAEGVDHAYLLRFENYKRNITHLSDTQLKQLSPTYATVTPYLAITNLQDFNVSTTALGAPEPAIAHFARKILDHPKNQDFWSYILLRLMANPLKIIDTIEQFYSLIEAELPYISYEEQFKVLHMIIVVGSFELLQKRGAHFGWTYSQTQQLYMDLAQGLTLLIHAHYLQQIEVDKSELEAHVAQISQIYEHIDEPLSNFLKNYKLAVERRQGPCAGCTYCRTKCLYRNDVHTLYSDTQRQWVEETLRNSDYQTNEERFSAVSNVIINIASGWLNEGHDTAKDIGYCMFAYHTHESLYSEQEQAHMATLLNTEVFISSER